MKKSDSPYKFLLILLLLWGSLVAFFACHKEEVVPSTPDASAFRTAYYPVTDTINAKPIIVKPIVQHAQYAGHDRVDITYPVDSSLGLYVFTSIAINNVPTATQGNRTYYTQPSSVVNGLQVWRPFFDDNYSYPPMWTQMTDKGHISLYNGTLDARLYTGILIYYYNYPDSHYFSQPFQFYGSQY